MSNEIPSNYCSPNNPDHIPPKRVGSLLGVTVTAHEPTAEEIRIADQRLAPLRERLGLEPFPERQPQILEPNKFYRLVNYLKDKVS